MIDSSENVQTETRMSWYKEGPTVGLEPLESSEKADQGSALGWWWREVQMGCYNLVCSAGALKRS